MLKIKDIFKSKKTKVIDKIEKCLINKTDIKIDMFDNINADAVNIFLGKIKKYKKSFDNENLLSLISKYDELKLSVPLENRLFGGYSINCSQEDFEERYLIFRFSKISDKLYKKIKVVEEVSNE